MRLQFETVVATGATALDSGIGDTALKTFNGETYLFSLSGIGGGIVAWHLVDGAAPVLLDQQYYSVTITQQVGRSGIPVTLAGSDHLILNVDGATGLVSYGLNADGTFGTLQETGTLTGGGDIGAAVQVSVGATDLLTLAHTDTGHIRTYHINNDGSLSAAGSVTAQADFLQTLHSGTSQFVIAADTASNAITTYSIDPGTGALTEITGNSALQMLGVNAPTALETVEAYGASWVIVAGAGSNSLSVLELGSDGQLTPTNHALDTLHTRFGDVQDISVVEVSGRVFIVAGGGDDGVTLFTLTPDGQLIHLDSFEDTLSSGLQNVESLSVARVGDQLQIFAASQQDAGLTQLSVDISDLGDIRQGYGTVTGTAQGDMLSGGILDTVLDGGAGDDILITGTSATTMTGGAGADIFVMRESSGPTTITDFQAGTDRLDLTDFSFLRSPTQLNVTSTAQGAQIQYRDETIEIISASGGPLTSTDIFGAGFDGPDHIPVNLNNDPDTNAAPGVLGAVHIESDTANPALQGAEVQFTPDGGATITAQANDQGEFVLDVPDGTFTGDLDIVKSYSTASAQITALDALQVLRIAVGLDPTFGPATPENLIAADITQDGTINALDALAILQVAVGLETAHDAEWVFLDADADLSGITRTNVSYDTGVSVTIVDGAVSADMTSILLGNVEAV
ncbi:beta-propeller fold lactonase family protein [Ruegeria sp.]|uniref:beta-propeller fold lactonase family protein n=1 Tax=Ruegeria sp. TaxID=1879320 RepID=UPI00230AADB0|nr:beta-propeller fold lactonase family protein [Ruegeria sp.]MDA7963994.1 beta-propeller fold lactonase family protein [Ruegeria sp.]